MSLQCQCLTSLRGLPLLKITGTVIGAASFGGCVAIENQESGEVDCLAVIVRVGNTPHRWYGTKPDLVADRDARGHR